MAINFLNDSRFPDNAWLGFGDSSSTPDLKIYHDGSNSYIQDSGTGNLIIAGTQVDIYNPALDEYKARFLTDGAVELYHNNSKKIETTATGVSITGGFVTTASSDCAGLNMTSNIAMGSSDITDSNSSAGTAGQVLSSLGSGNGVDWVDATTGDITGVTAGNYLNGGGTSGTVTVNHDTTSRSDTTSSASPGSAGTFTAVDSVTTGTYGHITALNLKTVTMPTVPTVSGVYLPLAGGTMAGNIAMGDNDITGIDQLTFTSGTYLTDVSSNYVELRYASTAAGGIIVIDGDGLTQGYLYADGNATSSFGLLDGSGSWAVKCAEDAEVELRYDNSKKFETTNTGVTVSGVVTATGGTSTEWNTAYDNYITGISDSGSSTITLTLTQNDGGTLTTSFSNPQGTVTSVTAGTGLDGGTITGSGTIDLADTAVSAGSYTNASITVDAQGRLTSASTGSDAQGVTSVATTSPILGGTITGTGTISHATQSDTETTSSETLTSADTFTAYTSVSTNATGHVTGHNLKTYTLPTSVSSSGVTSVTFTSDSGSTSAVTSTGTIDIAGGTNVSTSATGSTVTINATDTTYSCMTTSTLGLGKLRYTQGSTPAAESQTTTANRTYGVTENGSCQLVVNVPWTDNNSGGTVTSIGITAGTGISVSGSPVTGSGNITVTNTAPATVDGSGAANRVAYWSDSDTLTSDSDLTFDGTNLSIGNPMYAADGGKGAPSYSFTSDANTGVYLEDPDKLGLTAGGNVGLIIGSASVTSKVDFTVDDSDIILDGDSNIQLDTAIASTESSGTIIKFGSAMSMSAGQVMYGSNSMGSLAWSATDADTNTKNIIGLALGSSPTSDGLLLNGIYHDASHGFTVGLPLYLSTTGGEMTTTAPSGSGDYVRVVGYAIDSNHIYFCPDNTWVIID